MWLITDLTRPWVETREGGREKEWDGVEGRIYSLSLAV